MPKRIVPKIDSHELSRRINVGELNRHAAVKIRVKDSADALSKLDDFDDNPESIRFFELIDKGCPLIYLVEKQALKSTIVRKLQRKFAYCCSERELLQSILTVKPFTHFWFSSRNH